MTDPFLALPLVTVSVDAGAPVGPLELWRHTVGHGGINALPLPDRVVGGIQKLKPRLVRTFIQEYFTIYPDHDRFDWTTLDPYMDALAQTGAKVVAAIAIKPSVLFPTIDHALWQPTDVAEWQRVIYQLVKRYSVDRPYVTYWEIGNETDIGESGGSPYLIKDPAAYGEWYRMTIQAVLEAFPAAKVGGPAACWVDNEPLPGLITWCRDNHVQLDFISWHLYSDDPGRHAIGVERAKMMLEGFPGRRPEMLVTEWSKGFERVADVYDPYTQQMGRVISVEEMAFAPRRAALTAASILSMLEAGLDWSFYYHMWDQVFFPDAFQHFFSPGGNVHMLEHWNEVPHRFGLFSVEAEVRPQYFVYQLLSRMGDERLTARVDHPDVRVLAAWDGQAVATFLTNSHQSASGDCVVSLHYTHLVPGLKSLTVYRIDADRRWSTDTLELQPVEHRTVYALEAFRCHVYVPGDSVVMISLTGKPGDR